MSKTIIQTLKSIEDLIYTFDYDAMPEYLQGVRDLLNIVNGTEDNEGVEETIIDECQKLARILKSRFSTDTAVNNFSINLNPYDYADVVHSLSLESTTGKAVILPNVFNTYNVTLPDIIGKDLYNHISELINLGTIESVIINRIEGN